jgi:hypothetical protein
MIFYRPTDGDVESNKPAWRPRTCFLMAAMGQHIPPEVKNAKRRIKAALKAERLSLVDASSVTTGKDFLLKIWSMAVACPIGIAIVHKGIRRDTMANIYYELGLMQSYGRQTIVIKVGAVKLPSDFVRTEYINFDGRFMQGMRDFVSAVRKDAAYYEVVAKQLEKNPLLAIDYLRRAYLLTGKKSLKREMARLFASSGLDDRAPNSVERLLASV